MQTAIKTIVVALIIATGAGAANAVQFTGAKSVHERLMESGT